MPRILERRFYSWHLQDSSLCHSRGECHRTGLVEPDARHNNGHAEWLAEAKVALDVNSTCNCPLGQTDDVSHNYFNHLDESTKRAQNWLNGLRSGVYFELIDASIVRALLSAMKQLRKENEQLKAWRNCPRCDSPNPKLHPAMQYEGEICNHPFHVVAERDELKRQLEDLNHKYNLLFESQSKLATKNAELEKKLEGLFALSVKRENEFIEFKRQLRPRRKSSR